MVFKRLFKCCSQNCCLGDSAAQSLKNERRKGPSRASSPFPVGRNQLTPALDQFCVSMTTLEKEGTIDHKLSLTYFAKSALVT